VLFALAPAGLGMRFGLKYIVIAGVYSCKHVCEILDGGFYEIARHAGFDPVLNNAVKLVSSWVAAYRYRIPFARARAYAIDHLPIA